MTTGWELVDSNFETKTYRLKVYGGWIVQVINKRSNSSSSCFVPDVGNEWRL